MAAESTAIRNAGTIRMATPTSGSDGDAVALARRAHTALTEAHETLNAMGEHAMRDQVQAQAAEIHRRYLQDGGENRAATGDRLAARARKTIETRYRRA